MTESTPLDYQAPSTRMSVLAIVVLAVGGLSLPLFFLGIPAVIGVVLAVVAYRQIEVAPGKLTGLGLARAGGYMALGSLLLFLGALLLVPSLHSARSAGGRSYCAANIRGVLQSMIVYSAENSDMLPVMPAPPAARGYGLFTTVAATTSSDVTLANMYGTASPMSGDVTASLWILVLKQQCTPKQFICKSDPSASSVASPVTSGGEFLSNFTPPPGSTDTRGAISYSIAYPWTATGRVGPWWKNLTDSSLPLMSDMAPMNGTGSRPVANVTTNAVASGGNKQWNSGNHNRDGQYVGYGDVHASFERSPTVGQNQDNIFTASRTGRPDQVGTPMSVAFRGVVVPADAKVVDPTAVVLDYGGPYDIVMVPARNLTTGELR